MREAARLAGVATQMGTQIHATENYRRAVEAIRAGAAVKLGCDHTHYPAHVVIAAETLASLAGDLA